MYVVYVEVDQVGLAKIVISTGFRSYVRQFWGAIVMLLRPSVPGCFAAKKPRFRKARCRQEASRKEATKCICKYVEVDQVGLAKIVIFYRFQKLR